ncbi:bifunctional alpha/beta hydrolase/OsmC family protein [Sphingomonas sp. PR090111-T3T-6A]|uniref:bifunctional alpha/beta hydrolase/OsmC family protein n=1 Tax=Sphingomonas sp. PR090111-T3T-6A TaxID=685778 RepID=UPI0003660F9A|nr:bifunctional alpha/beta hydrolase/OsmC family protein [Sphingomonas sp. PR090111-T3T-6A]
MSTRSFDFDSASGYRLSGRLEAPETTPVGWAIFAHCFTCGKDNIAATRITRALAQRGIGVLRFDFAGLGASGGQFADFAADVRDLITAADAMAAEGKAPALLIGHSMGGAAVLAAANELPTVKAVATIGAPGHLRHVLHQFGPEQIDKIEREQQADVRLAGRPFSVGLGFLEQLRQFDLPGCIAELGRPLLVLHAPLDETVGIENAQQIFGAAKHPKSFISLDDADHLLTRRSDADFAAGVIAAWAARYLPPIQADAPAEAVVSGADARTTGAGKFQLSVRVGPLTIIADEPESLGGMGSGPNPYDLLSAGLAACTSMTVKLVADHKGFPLEHVRTRVEHEKIEGATPADLFTRTISFEGHLDAEQEAKLLDIANRCPVHKTLSGGSRVETKYEP